MAGTQSAISELDVSQRLRHLMTEHKLNVSDMAQVAGVSKSAMEKYLAGPSSPRATAIASICFALNVNAHWLLFGKPEQELHMFRQAVSNSVGSLLNDLKQQDDLADKFSSLVQGSKDWRLFVWQLSDDRALEAIDGLLKLRKHYAELSGEGFQEVDDLLVMPLNTSMPNESL